MTRELRSEAELARLYRANRTPRLVWVPELTFLMIDGHGDPNTEPGYQAAVRALFSLSYAIRSAMIQATGVRYKVAPLEGLWWAADLRSLALADKGSWQWTMMQRQPAEVSVELLSRCIEQVLDRDPSAAVAGVRMIDFDEGPAVQVLHVGPYSAEAPTIALLHSFIADHGWQFDGQLHKHHEIYLGDPRRADPQRLRTILRQPIVAPAGAPGLLQR